MTFPPLTCAQGHPVRDPAQQFCEICGAPVTGSSGPGSPGGRATARNRAFRDEPQPRDEPTVRYGGGIRQSRAGTGARQVDDAAWQGGDDAWQGGEGDRTGAGLGYGAQGPGPAFRQQAYRAATSPVYTRRMRQARRPGPNPMIFVVGGLAVVVALLGGFVWQLSGGFGPGGATSSPGGSASASGPGGVVAGGSSSPSTTEAPGDSGEASATPKDSATPKASKSPKPSATPATSPTPEPSASASAPPVATSCTSELYRFEISYPKGWHTVEDDPNWTCHLFDPDPITIDPATELPEVAVLITMIESDLDTVYASIIDPVFWEAVEGSEQQTTVAGQPAIRLELVATGEGLYPKGMLSYVYLFERDGSTYTLETHGFPKASGQSNPGNARYKANRKVLDSMAKSMSLT